MKSVLLILCLIAVSFQIEMKLYDVAGDYIIKPEDYEYQDNIIIELWGAGSGSMSFSNQQQNIQCAGNSGAYIKVKVDTSNQEMFYFSLGEGGKCSYGTGYGTNYGAPGNYSIFYSEDKELLLNVSGGSAHNQASCSKQVALINSTKHRADDIIITVANGTITSQNTQSYNQMGENCMCNNGYGSSSPFGPNGGNRNSPNKCNGYMGSGSGYNCNYCIANENNSGCIGYYKGGDGALIVYY